MKVLFTAFLILFLSFFTVLNAQWSEIGTPDGGPIKAIVYCRGHYIVSTNNGMFKSGDNCATWNRITYFDNMTIPSSYNGSEKLVTNDSILYYATTSGTLYKSIDIGNTWQINSYYQCNMGIAAKGSFVAVCEWCSGGMNISTNNGQTWTNSLNGSNVDKVFFGFGSTIFCRENIQGLLAKGVYSGTWTPTNLLSDFGSGAKLVLLSNGYLVLEYGNLYFKYIDEMSWTEVNKPGYVNSLIALDNMIIVKTSSGYYVRTTGFEWALTNIPINIVVNSIAQNDETIAISTSVGVFVSEDEGITWVPRNANLKGCKVLDIAHNNDTLFVGTDIGLFLSLDNGDTYIGTGFNSAVNEIQFYQNKWYVHNTQSLFCSQDNGLTWSEIDLGFDEYSDLAISTFSVNDNKIVVGILQYYYGQNIVFQSLDYGETFTDISNGIYNEGFDDYRGVSELVQFGDTIFVGTEIDGVWYSIDNGVSWVDLNNGLPSTPNEWGDPNVLVYPAVSQITLLGDSIVLAAQDQLYKRGFLDTVWSSNQQDVSISYISIKDTLIFGCSQYSNVYYCIPDYNLWVPINSGLPVYSYVKKIIIGDTLVFCASQNLSKIWSRSIPELSIQQLSGTIYEDSNNNQVFDTDEHGLPHVDLELDDANYTVLKGTQGDYIIFSDPGEYSLRIQSPLPYATVYPAAYDVDITASNLDFGIHFNYNVEDLRVVITPITAARPGFDVKHRVTFKNIGSNTVSGNVILNYSDTLSFLSATDGFLELSNNNLEWQFGDLQPFEERSFDVLYNLPASINIGEQLLSTVNIEPELNDSTPNNNFDILSQVVTGSFDPNYKTVNQRDTITPDFFLVNDELQFTVHFQNVGNDTAFNIVIIDTLSPELDPSSFIVLAASHEYTYEIIGENVVKFKFRNILLPPSVTNEIGSNGFFKYSIKIENHSIGTEIANTAYIYFDFNEAIVTNTTLNSIIDPFLFDENEYKNSELEIFPNPNTGNFNVKVSAEYEKDAVIQLIDNSGKVIGEKILDKSGYLSYTDLKAGIYLVKVIRNKDILTKKIVVF